MNRGLVTTNSSLSPSRDLSEPHQPRKRRRPALSCDECRRRKVKCDQKVPCTPCAKAKTVACKYDPDATPKGRLYPANFTSTTSKILPRHPRVAIAVGQNDNSQVIAPSVLGYVLPNLNSQPNTTPTEIPPLQETPQGQSVQELNERIQQLEAMVTSIINTEKVQISPPNDFGGPNSSIVPQLKGSTHKSRFFTTSHWMNTKKEFDQILALKKTKKLEDSSELNDALRKCKDLARAIKKERPKTTHILPNVKDEMPVRATADLLVRLYFRSFESVYRILHRPSFFHEYEQYWINPALATDSFMVKVILVMSIGSIFTEEENIAMRSLGLQWINTAHAWLNAPHDKSRLNLASVEVECLLILARQTHSVGGDLLWISVGTLIRTAMSIGLHRDPSNFHKISPFQAEMKRRIWATVVELAVQASLDCGMPPMISLSEFDTLPPGNYNDDFLSETDTILPPSPPSVITETRIQIRLLSSLPTRLKIFTTISNIHTPPPYEKILSLSTELLSHLSSHQSLYASPAISPTHRNLLDLLVRRYLLALHLPYAILSKSEPQYYFSRKTALDAAVLIFSYPCPANEDFTRMKLLSGSYFREAFSRASVAISLELIMQINEDSTSSYPSFYPLTTEMQYQAKTSRKGLHNLMSQIVELSRERLRRGETNVKGFLFWSMVKAQTQEMENGNRNENVIDAIAKGAKEAAEEAYEILRGQVSMSSSEGSAGGVSLMGSPGDIGVDWDALMQASNMDFDMTNTWLLDSWEAI